MSNSKVCIIVFFTILLTACSPTKMYDGVELPAEKVSELKGTNPWDLLLMSRGWKSTIINVDGQPVPGGGSHIAVLPGEHKFKVYLKLRGVYDGTEIITLNTKPGYIYNIGYTDPPIKIAFIETLNK